MASGVAGRTDYAKWDKVTTDLVTEVEKEEEDDTEEQKKALGLDGKYARSQAEAEERAKLSSVKKAKKVLETYKKREGQIMQEFPRLLGPIENDDEQATGTSTEEHKATEDTIVRITREQLEAGKRVITLCDTAGASQHDTIVLTQDLSHLESKMASGNSANIVPKEYPDDADNQRSAPTPTQRSVFGIIKLFIHNVRNCTILIKCKVISGTVELSHCRNVVLRVEQEATVATIQADLCQDIHIEFRDAPSGKNIPGSPKTMYWGEDKDDRIFHAGVKQMKVSIVRDGFVETERMLDYIADGAVAIGNATPEEYQFVTSVIDGELATEKVVRAGATTGKNARAMTERELEEERIRREKAAAMAIDKAEDMIRLTNKHGEVIKAIPKPETVPAQDDDAVEEIYASMTKDEIRTIVDECEHNKRRGNEAFEAGEYAQAILLYSLALDKADELPDKDGGGKSLFPRHILLCNRSACFLKLGEHEKAFADATRAQSLEPTFVKALFRRGLALHALGRYAEALPILGEAHKMEPKNQQIKQALQFAEVRHEQEIRKRMQG
jgi:hypothetical protein